VLAADPDLQVLARLSSARDGHPDQFADAFLVEGLERVFRENALLDVGREERARVVAAVAERPLREVVRAEGEELRDLRDLRLVKTREGYKEMAPEETGPGFSILAGEFLNDVLRAQNLIVLKTSPGHANSVAVALDGEGWPEIVGTIAGDDTILVITSDISTAEAIQERLLELLES
jgi:transcriptional regulator of arginine metabolism